MFDKAGELESSHSLTLFMSHKFNLDPLGILEIIDDHLPSLLGTHSNSMPICTERNGAEGDVDIDLLDLLAFHDVEEVDALVQACTAEEQVVHWREGNACANVCV